MDQCWAQNVYTLSHCTCCIIFTACHVTSRFQLLMWPLNVLLHFGIHTFIWRDCTLFTNFVFYFTRINRFFFVCFVFVYFSSTLIQIPGACFKWQVQTGPVTLLKLSLTRVSTVLKGNRLNCLKGAGLRRVTDFCAVACRWTCMWDCVYIFFTE